MNATTSTAISTTRFINNADGTVTDTATGLMWTESTLTDVDVDHAEAERICSALDLAGHNDWRWPTVAELFTLIDHSRHSPAIDTTAFPDTRGDWYWTSTPCAWSPDLAWFVLFGVGDVGDVHRDDYDGALVRAVRSVSAPAGQ